MSIKSLPVEVMSIICSHVQILERKTLRLTCRTLCTTSSGDFFDRYFKSIHFMVTSDSLGRLEDLAQSDVVRKRVQELWMIPTVFDGVHQLGENNMGEFRVSSKSCQPLDGDELRDRYHTYKAMITDNSDLLNSHNYCADVSSQVTLPEVQYDSRLPFLDSVEDLHLCIELERDTWVKLVY